MKRISVLLLFFIALFLWSCENVKNWSDPEDNIPPGIVTDVQVENINGGAIISYKLPADEDLLAVKAIYVFEENGEEKEAYSSAYNNTIVLEGFPDTSERNIYLYAVDKSKNESSPVEVTIKPLTPPVDLVRETLRLNATFGGVYALWDNSEQNDISITLYRKNDEGDYEYYDAYYTQMKEGKYTFRGMENIPQEFRIEIRDKWNNYSHPLDTIITPLFEEEIVGRELSNYIWQRWGYDDGTCVYRGDAASQRPEATRQFPVIHDGVTLSNAKWWHTYPITLNDYVEWPVEDYSVKPLYFTIDMGRMASYSRFTYWMRNNAFVSQAFSQFEVWGTNNPKPLNEIGDGSKEQTLMYWTDWPEVKGTGEWRNDWVKLADYSLVLPSGATVVGDPVTDEDIQYIRNGFEVEIDPQYADTPFRYLRFVIRKQIEANDQIQLVQLKFWGAYSDK